jgi:hypothetical protein
MKSLLIGSGVAVLLAVIIPAAFFELKARRRLSSLGEQNPWRVYFLGLFAGEQYFTPEGWRYHQRATHLGVLGGALFLVLVLVALRYLRAGA